MKGWCTKVRQKNSSSISNMVGLSTDRRYLLIEGHYLHLFKKEPRSQFSFTDKANALENVSIPNMANANSADSSSDSPYTSIYLGSISFIREYDSSPACKVFEVKDGAGEYLVFKGPYLCTIDVLFKDLGFMGNV